MSYDKLLKEAKTLSSQEFLDFFNELQEIVKKEYDLKKTKNNTSELINSRRFDVFRGRMRMSEDFDEPLADFDEYMR